jgi:hypothetical protein
MRLVPVRMEGPEQQSAVHGWRHSGSGESLIPIKCPVDTSRILQACAQLEKPPFDGGRLHEDPAAC